MWRKLFDILFWIGLATYFGGMITVGAIVAPSVFATAHDHQLSMPGITAPLEMDRQVGGEIFGDILNRFAYIEYSSLAMMLVAIAGWMLGNHRVRISSWLIIALWLLLGGILSYDALAIRPKVFDQRELVRSTALAHTADKPVTPWPEKAQFDSLHTLSEDVGKAKVYVLFALLVVASLRGLTERKPKQLSPPITPAAKKR